jgi:hypothetical protein
MRRPWLVLVTAFLAAGLVAAQTVPPPAPPPSPSVQHVVKQQFGASCDLLPGNSFFTGDLDGDGVEDAAIAARCTNPMPDQADFGFHVIDPYDGFYGYGDVSITSGFVTLHPERRHHVVLIIHGSGAEAWRAAKPKAKFLVINLPFEQISVKGMMLKQKPMMAVFADESSEGPGTISALYWDGKKYRYQPVGSKAE